MSSSWLKATVGTSIHNNMSRTVIEVSVEENEDPLLRPEVMAPVQVCGEENRE